MKEFAASFSGLDLFPERGTLRDDVRPRLRIIGLERRIAVAVEAEAVVILRILYAGRQMDDPLAGNATPDP